MPSRSPGVSVVRYPGAEPDWAVGYGSEFWRAKLQNAVLNGVPEVVARTGLSAAQLGDAVQRVSHAFRPARAGDSVQASGGTFQVKVEATGLSLLPAQAGGGEIRFRTRTVSFAGSIVAERPESLWTITGNTAQVLLDGGSGIVEHLEVRPEGIEVTWVLARRPPVDGELIIEAEVAGAGAVMESMNGAPTGNPTRAPRVKVGPALAVDSTGRSWRLQVEATEEGFRVTVPALVLAEASFPLAVDPLITPEFSLDNVLDGPSPCTRAAPMVAANQSGYLVVWAHGRSEVAEAAIYAARVSPSGVLLDPYGIVLSTQAGEQSTCAAAANEGMFLVTWAAPRGTANTDWDILGARILDDGTVLDRQPLAVCTALGTVQNSPCVAGNGESFLAAWRDSRSTSIYGTLVTTNGVLSATNGVVLLNGANDQYTPAVAALGTNFLVVAQDYRKATTSAYNSDIYGARVDGRGVLLDQNGIVICTNAGSQFHPGVAADGTNYLVAWQDYDLAGSDIRAARVTADGILLDTNAFVVCHDANSQANPSAASGDGVVLVAWQDYRDSAGEKFEARIRATRVSGEGVVLAPEGTELSPSEGGQCRPALAGRSGEWLAVWQDFRNNSGSVLSDIMGVALSVSNGLASSPADRFSGAANAHLSPAVAALGTNYFAVWADNRHGTSNDWDICGMRLDLSGVPIDGAPLWICTATNRQSDPVVAAGQGGFLVAWSDWRNTPPTLRHGDIFGSVVSPEGKVLNPDGIAICTATNDQSLPAVTSFGTNFLVVWQDARSNQPPNARMDIYGARLTGSGDLLDGTGFPICAHLAIQTNPVVAATPNRALVVWTDYRASATQPDIYAARVDPDGSVIEPVGFPVCNAAATAQNLPALASDGARFFAVWADSRHGGTRAPDIYGAAIEDSGAVVPFNGFAIRAMTGVQTAPDVSYNGLDFLVAWQEAQPTTNLFDIYAAQIDPQKEFGIGPVLPVVTNLNSQTSPAVTGGADGRFLVLNQGTAGPFRRTMGSLVNSESIPRLDHAGVPSGGVFRFRFRGAIGMSYSIETSEDLQTWAPFLRFTSSSPTTNFTDLSATNLSRFYRAVLLP